MSSATLFEGFVPRYVLEHLDEVDTIKPAELNLDDARLLFADISGSTEMGERLAGQGPAGAEELARRLNSFFGALIESILSHGGDIAGFAGDALIAYWAGDTTAPIEAALDIQQRVASLDVGGEQIHLRLSVGTGALRRLVLGGKNDRWHDVVTGDALADAGAASDLTEPDEVVLSAAMAELYGAQFPGVGRPDGSMLLHPRSSGAATDTETDDMPEAGAPGGSGHDESILRSFVPSPVLANFDAGHHDWLGELRTVTVVFAGLPDLGSESPLIVAQELVTGAQIKVAQVDASLNKISVDDKGIAVLAALGMPPRAHEDDGVRGARLGLELARVATNAGNRCYVGVATGRVFCGTIGNDDRLEYTLIGNTVNRAARLMAHAMTVDANAAVLADEATTALTETQVHNRALPPVELKGITETVTPALLISMGDRSPGEGSELASAFVGRSQIVAKLRATMANYDPSHPPVTVIEGEPGIGKSTLLRLAVDAAKQAGIRVAQSYGDDIERTTPYGVIRPLFTQLLDLPAGDPAGHSQFILDRLGPELASQAALLNDVLPVAFEPTELTMKLPADAGPAIVQGLVAGALATIAGERPTMLGIEDFHWFDAASINVIAEVASTGSCGVLLTSRTGDVRPAEVDTIAKQPDAVHIELGPLDRPAVASLVAATLRAPLAADALVDAIFSRGSGHPLFTQELARAMSQEELLEIDESSTIGPRARVNLDEVSFPESLEGIIGHRLDHLPPDDQLTLKVASVIGQTFTLDALAAIHPDGHEAARLGEHLDDLRDYELVMGDGDDYQFIHALTRDAAYERLLFSQRALLHAGLAEWYSAKHDEQAVLGQLAHHWEGSWLAAKEIERPSVDLETVRAKAANALEKATDGALASGLPRESLELGLRATRVLGVEFPTAPELVGPAIETEMQRVGELSGANHPDQLAELPSLEDPDVERAVMLILRLQPSAAIVQDLDLFALFALRNYGLVLEHGLGIGAPGAIAVYASLEPSMTGEAAAAHQRTTFALDLARRQGGMMLSYTAFVHQWLINHWHRPITEIFALGAEAAEAGFAQGDVIFGSFNAAAAVVSKAMSGAPLDEVIDLADENDALIDGRVHSAAFHCRHERQLAQALAGRTVHPQSFTDDRFSEESDIASILETPSMNQVAAYLASKARLAFYYRDLESAVTVGMQTAEVEGAMTGQLLQAEFVFFHTLALLQRAAEVDETVGVEFRDQAAGYADRLRQWANWCPNNFEHKIAIVRGVEAITGGDAPLAASLLDQAAAAAADTGFVQHEALAHELAAQARVASGDREGARRSADAAVDAYERWGAAAKVSDVEAQFSELAR